MLSACGGSNGGDAKATTARGDGDRPAEASLATEDSSDATAAAWSFCSSEQGMCTFSGTRQVRYGNGGLYKYATYNDGVRCASSVFGDPVPGKVKACSVSVAQTDDAETPTAPQTRPTTQGGNITLAWIAPRTNADGSPLTDLAGYRVRYGTSSGSYSSTVEIDDPHKLNHVLKGLPSSTYYLIVTAYNSANIESLASVEVSKSIE
ncbi:MAG: fibronectin type III domain-containing protein [Methylibium sp.]|uniref:fibronectin type III domain-containing protein n=1 Tax=Methylibium sp. TaxID=2067992 RepID=UPI0017D0F4FA|nr:fibronectin type III domain-containing protein [Methylibium sp.]MBA3597186.1 fibronectin type III domain-containing protein [Methylibium sp.]